MLLTTKGFMEMLTIRAIKFYVIYVFKSFDDQCIVKLSCWMLINVIIFNQGLSNVSCHECCVMYGSLHYGSQPASWVSLLTCIQTDGWRSL